MRHLLFLIFALPTILCAEDPALWSTIKLQIYKSPCWNISSFVEHRTTEYFHQTEASVAHSMFTYTGISHIDLGVGSLHLRHAKKPHKYEHRLLLEANPYLEWERVKIQMRNRLELRHRNGGGGDGTRVRQRWNVTWSPPCSKWKVFHSNELFYDFELGKATQNRLVPLGLRYPIQDKVSVEQYYMLKNSRSGSNWPTTHIVGLGLMLTL